MSSTISDFFFDAFTTLTSSIPMIYNSTNISRLFSRDCLPDLDKVIEGVKFAFSELAKGYQALRDSNFVETGAGVAIVGVVLTLTCLGASSLCKKSLLKPLFLLAAIATVFFTAYAFESGSVNIFASRV